MVRWRGYNTDFTGSAGDEGEAMKMRDESGDVEGRRLRVKYCRPAQTHHPNHPIMHVLSLSLQIEETHT